MKIFNQLRPFVFICQAAGFCPFFIETKKSTDAFIKFSFAWKKPLTWWFIFIFVLQFVFAIFDTNVILQVFFGEGIDRGNIPQIFSVYSTIELFFFFILLGGARYIIFRYPHMKRAIELVNKVHHNLASHQKNFQGAKILSINRPVAAGICLTFACVRISC